MPTRSDLANAPSRPGSRRSRRWSSASLIQAEAGTAADAPKIAAVIANRLQAGHRRCRSTPPSATPRAAARRCPTNADKQLDSPYNTYRVHGLPPTPIMTVTEQSLRAALAPADVPYLFYVTGKDGVHVLRHDAGGARARTSRAHGVTGMTVNVDGATRVTGLIGDPVAHSRSPAILNAAFREAGLDWVYVAFPVPRGHGARRGARRRALRPRRAHRHHAAQGRRRLGVRRAHARRDRARRGQRGHRRATTAASRGSSTDGEGFLRSVRDEGFDPAGADVLVARRRRRRPGDRRSPSGARAPGSPSPPAGATRPTPPPRWCPAGAARRLDEIDPGVVRPGGERHARSGCRARRPPIDRGPPQPGPIGGRHRVPPYGDASSRRRPRPRDPRRQRAGHARPPGRARVRALDRRRGPARGDAHRRRVEDPRA